MSHFFVWEERKRGKVKGEIKRERKKERRRRRRKVKEERVQVKIGKRIVCDTVYESVNGSKDYLILKLNRQSNGRDHVRGKKKL